MFIGILKHGLDGKDNRTMTAKKQMPVPNSRNMPSNPEPVVF